MGYLFLSSDVAIIQWIMLCQKNCMTTLVITLWREHVTSLTTSVSTILFLIEIKIILKAIKSNFKGNLTLVVISYEMLHCCLTSTVNIYGHVRTVS